MVASSSKRILICLVLAIPIAACLVTFVDSCGSIHGSLRCGAVSGPAIVVFVLALMLGDVVLRSPPNDLTVHTLVWVVAYGVAFGSCLLLGWLLARARRH